MDVSQTARPALVIALAVAMCVGVGLATRQPQASAGDLNRLAQRFSFAESDVNGEPPGARAERAVQPQLEHIRAWISAVGASAGLGDFDGDRLSNEACLVDPRDDSVSVLPVPGHPRPFVPFALVPHGVAYDARTTAPMGCVAADLNADGYTDVLVYFWGREPLAYLRRPGSPLGPDPFVPVDVVPGPAQIRNSTTANVLDIDGDGHLDLFIGNYFPDGARVLDPTAAHDPLMAMQDSMSNARNAGANVILRFDSLSTVDGIVRPVYTDASSALTYDESHGWTLATGAQDLNGDGRPELYIANDFGPDYLLLNESTPGRIRFSELRGRRGAGTPKSKVVGADSFKSMGVTYTDLNGDGRPDLVVSNITTARGLEESNFAFVSTDTGPLTSGVAPYRDESEELGLSRSGWAWDIKAADFDGDGTDELVQAVGFVAGNTNRWAQLQELAITDDLLVRYPGAWPNFPTGTDIAGHQRDLFFARDVSGRYEDLAEALGISNAGPTRSVAVGDVDHDGKPDVLLANQWARSQFLHNTGPDRAYLGLRVLLPATGPAPAALPRPAIGAAVAVTKPDGTVLRAQLFPANGHTGGNAPELLFGLGAGLTQSVDVTITWRDGGGLHGMTTALQPGWHDITLGTPSAG